MMNYLGMIGPWQIIIISFAFLGIIPTIIALIDILKNKFEDNHKIVWILVVLFFNMIGAILYFTIGRKQKIKNPLI
jgi:Phospholipase_D-nuclease N-terminal